MTSIELGKYFEKKKEVFKNATVFDNGYYPEKPIERKEAAEIMQKVADFMRLGVADNLFIAGKHGFGKTLYGKYLVDEINEVAKKINKPIQVQYRNCRDYSDEYSLLMNLSGFEDENSYQKNPHKIFCEKLKSDFILILDEIDRLDGADDMLYFLTRISETHSITEYKIQLILISNKIDWDKDVDNAARSSLNLTKIIFNEYNKSQIKDILKQRIKLGLLDLDIIPEKMLNLIVDKTLANSSDLRIAIKALFLLCKEIEKNGSKEISENDVDNLYEKAIKEIQRERIAGLDDVRLFILYAISKAREHSVRSIYEQEYKEACKNAKVRVLGYSRFTFYLKALQDQNMVSITKDKRDKVLYNKATSKVNKDALEEEYENRKILSAKYNI